MTTIQLTFPWGRFYATPWGINASRLREPEWPPSPWRLLRALVSAWFRAHPGQVPSPHCIELIDALGRELPEIGVGKVYCLQSRLQFLNGGGKFMFRLMPRREPLEQREIRTVGALVRLGIQIEGNPGAGQGLAHGFGKVFDLAVPPVAAGVDKHIITASIAIAGGRPFNGTRHVMNINQWTPGRSVTQNINAL